MAHFTYSLLLTLIHSLWQGAFFLLLFRGFNFLFGKHEPAAKRNLLFSLLFIQVALSVTTFVMVHWEWNILDSNTILISIAGLVPGQSALKDYSTLAMGLYLLLLFLKGGHLFFNWQKFTGRYKSSLVKPPVDIKLFAQKKAWELGILRKVTLWYCGTVDTPLTFGLIKPVILLPVALLNNLTLAETEALVIHELSHIKNNDYLFNWLLIGCETIFYFNPFIRELGSRIRLEREKYCDTQVLQFNYSAISYAETLLKTATLKHTATPFLLAAGHRNAQLLKRVRFFTNKKNLEFSRRNYSGMVIGLGLVGILTSVFLLDVTHKRAGFTLYSLPSISAISAENRYEKTFNRSFAILPGLQKNSIQPLKKHSINKNHGKTATEAGNIILEMNENEATGDQPSGNFAFPAALIHSDDSKEITFTEENSFTGKSVTKIYKLKFIRGQWKASLLLIIEKSRPVADSCGEQADTSHFTRSQ